MPQNNRDCRTCMYSAPAPFEDQPDARVCMRYPPSSHPLYPAGEPIMIGTCSMRAPLKEGEWCYEWKETLSILL